MEKLSEESLNQSPEEIFEIVAKLGEGSYGSVFKAKHKESGNALAIKQVPVDTDLQEIIKEISMMQQCDSPFIVGYYGSYFKDTHLWIVMEYCGAGSVLDIIKLKTTSKLSINSKEEMKNPTTVDSGHYSNLTELKAELNESTYDDVNLPPLNEEEIAAILRDTLNGLEYLHVRKKIHRDVKAGNILLSESGIAKLADFGVSGQLSDTMSKRNTVIGTPYWMAPEVIQEIGYDFLADIWSLGITCIEMATGSAPHAHIHPMRAIFMIPVQEPPTLNTNKISSWSSSFVDFTDRCLQKSPSKRFNSTQLLSHPFISKKAYRETLLNLIRTSHNLRIYSTSTNSQTSINSESHYSATSHSTGTFDGHRRSIEISERSSNVSLCSSEDCGTMIQHSTCGSTSSSHRCPSLTKKGQDRASINSNDVVHDKLATLVINEQSTSSHPFTDTTTLTKKSLQIIRNGNNTKEINAKTAQTLPDLMEENVNLSYLQHMTHEQLCAEMLRLDSLMHLKVEELRVKYHAKRQPILDAIDLKRSNGINRKSLKNEGGCDNFYENGTSGSAVVEYANTKTEVHQQSPTVVDNIYSNI